MTDDQKTNQIDAAACGGAACGGAERAARNRSAKRAAAKIAAAALVALFLTAVVMGAVGLTFGGTAFSSEITLSERPIRYSDALEKRFYRAFRLFFLTEELENPLFEWLIDDVYAALGAARVPSEKVVWLIENVETIRADENPAYLWIQDKNALYERLNKEYEDGLRNDPPAFREIVSFEELKRGIASALQFLAGSPLTNDEMGRLVYKSAILYAGDPDYTALLTEIGEKDIAMLTVGTYRVYRTAEAFGGAENVAAARAFGQSLVALGSSYLSLIKTIGLDRADTLFGLDYRIDPTETNGIVTGELIPFYNAEMDELKGFAGGALLMIGEILSALTDPLFEELFYEKEAVAAGKTSEAETHRVAAAYELSKGIRAGLENAKRKSEKRFETDAEAIGLLSKGYTAAFRLQDIFEGRVEDLKNEAIYEGYRAESVRRLGETIDSIGRLNDGLSADRLRDLTAFDAADAIRRDAPERFAALLSDAERVVGYDLSGAETLTDLLFGIILNAVVRFAGNQ